MAEIALPHDAKDETVILWALGVLVVAFLAVAKFLFDKIKANEARCLAESAAAKARDEAAQTEIKGLFKGVIHDQQQTQVQSNAAMSKIADALDRNTRVIETYMQDEETRTHHKRKTA